MAVAQISPEIVRLETPDFRTIEVKLRGTSALICHAWSDKAKKMMLDKQTKKASTGKAAKSPEADYLESLYPYPGGGYGFPAVAFKAAMVRAGTYSDLKMTLLRGAFHIAGGELVKIEGEPRPREDMVRLNGSVADIRYRGEFPKWSVKLSIKYNARTVSAEQIVNLLSVAGFGVGVGEWRPERDGSFGMFEVA